MVNLLWRDALNKVVDNLKVAFDIMYDSKYPPVHYTKLSEHLVFDVIITLERKSVWL